VGKSSLLSRFTQDEFTENGAAPTIGIDYSSRMIRVDRAICKLEIWDTAGR
jgi:Ras-related protein Rab-4B